MADPVTAEEKIAVPFRGQIREGMRPGKEIVITGIVDPCPDKFYISLSCGHGLVKEPPKDVALQLCARFKGQQVLRRACTSGTWSDMERHTPFFPFIKEQPFRIKIRCEQLRFRVLVDEEQLFDFYHKVFPLSAIDSLQIKGSFRVTKVC